MYVCVYIYVCEWMCGFFCVSGWVAKERISGIFEAALECPVSILAQRPHKALCPRKPAKPEERAKDVSQSETEGQSVRGEIPKQLVRSREKVSEEQRVSSVRSDTPKQGVGKLG